MQRPKPVSPLLSDPYLMGMVMPALVVLQRMAQRMADVLLVEEDQRHPEIVKSIKSSDLGVMVPGLSPVEIVTENFALVVGGKSVVTLELKTLLVDAKVYDVDLVCSWHPQVEVEMAALLKRMQVPTLLLMLGLGMDLSPRHEQLPGRLVVHLGQRQPEPGMAAYAAPFEPAHAAVDGPGFVMYPGHHNEGYDYPARPAAACDDDNPSWDGPSECQGCENFAICHSAAAEIAEPLRKAA